VKRRTGAPLAGGPVRRGLLQGITATVRQIDGRQLQNSHSANSRLSADRRLLTGVQALLTEVSEFFTLSQPKAPQASGVIRYRIDNTWFSKVLGDGTPIALQ
jgi:hypothetical protein